MSRAAFLDGYRGQHREFRSRLFSDQRRRLRLSWRLGRWWRRRQGRGLWLWPHGRRRRLWWGRRRGRWRWLRRGRRLRLRRSRRLRLGWACGVRWPGPLCDLPWPADVASAWAPVCSPAARARWLNRARRLGRRLDDAYEFDGRLADPLDYPLAALAHLPAHGNREEGHKVYECGHQQGPPKAALTQHANPPLSCLLFSAG